MTESKLQLNGRKDRSNARRNKTKTVFRVRQNASAYGITVPLSDSVKSLDVLLDNALSMQNFINQTVKSCYYQLYRISFVWKCLSTDVTVKLFTSLVLSRLDYRNSLLSDIPASSIHSLQHV